MLCDTNAIFSAQTMTASSHEQSVPAPTSKTVKEKKKERKKRNKVYVWQ
jgi:hypothetical protein